MAGAAPMGKKRMAAAALLAVVVWSSVCVQHTAAAVYKVGDSVGWTIRGNPNYTAWALSKTFNVGDVILFEYNKQFHNVMQVSRADYRACNASSPIATYATGNDSVTITTRGHHFFLCGVPGHCAIGQHVDINVPRQASSAAPSSAPTASTTAPAVSAGGPSAPSPNGNHAPSLDARAVLSLSLAVTAVLSFLLLA